LSSEDGFIKTLYIGPNQPIFDQAAFSLFLVGAMKAITPMYGEWARDFALLEAGYMSQLLMTEVTRYQLGLCPLGGLVDSAPLQKALILDDSQQILHTLLGGRLHPLQHTQWLQNPIRETTPRQQSALPLSLELQRHLEGKLPAYMIPTTYVALGALPVTANGKIDRKALPLPDLSHSTMPVAPPTSAIEKVLSGIVLEMTEIAEVETINIDQNFVELGLNSVHMVRFNNRLKERLNRQVPIAVLFQHPTIRSLARYLEEDDSQVDTLEAEKQVAKTSGEQRASARLANRQRQRR
jgi:aryl carrier-like protein